MEPVDARCPVCMGGFIGVAVYKTYKGRHYHTDCLRCSSCGASIGTRSTPPVEFEAQMYCATCAERCAGCDRPHGGVYLEVNGKKYHQICFKCMRCSKPLGQEVYLLDDCPACLKCCEEVQEIREAEAEYGI